MLTQDELHQQLFTLIKANHFPALIVFLNYYRDVIDINWKDESQNTVLHWTIGEGAIGLTQLLLDHGADVNAVNAEGNTPLHWAIGEEQQPIAELLLDRGANVDAKGTEGTVALHWAVLEHNLGLVRLLLSRGADMQSVDHEGSNPLHWAVQEGQKNIVELLVEQGADINAVDGDDRTPLQLAVIEDQREIIVYLIEESLLFDPRAIKPDFIEERINLSLKWDACAKEINRMQTYHIPGSRCLLSIFCLEKDPDEFARLIVAKDQSERLHTMDFVNFFPHYAERLRRQLRRVNMIEQLLAEKITDTDYSIYQFYQEKNVNKLSALLSNQHIEASVRAFISNENPNAEHKFRLTSISEIDFFYALRLKTRLNQQLNLGITRRDALKKLDIFTHDKVYGDLKLPKEILFNLANFLSVSDIHHLAQSTIVNGANQRYRKFFNTLQNLSTDRALNTHREPKYLKILK